MAAPGCAVAGGAGARTPLSRASRGLVVAALAAIGLAAASRLWGLPALVSGDVNEGWNAFHTALAMGGGALYPAPGGLTGSNYPPLSFFLVGALAHLTGLDLIVAGRMIALLGCIACAAAIWILARRLSPDPRAPRIAVLVFAALNATLLRRYIALDDPQWLAEAVMTAGWVVVMPRRAGQRPGWRDLAAGAALMVCAGFIKHNILAIPLGTGLWLALCHRRRLAIWLVAAIVALLLAMGLCVAHWGDDFLADLFDAPRVFSPQRALLKSLPVCAVLLPLAAIPLATRRWRADDRLVLAGLIAAAALVLGVVQRGGAGVDVSAHFDAAIALSLLAGACLPYATGTRARILGACAIVPVLVAWPFAVQHSLAELSDAPRAARVSRQAVAAIAALPGDVACQSVALCFWAGKPFVLDWFLTNQHIALTGDRSALTDALAARRFAAVQLDPATPRDGDDAIRAAVTAAYERRIAFPVGMLLQSR